MKSNLLLLTGAAVATGLFLSAQAAPERTSDPVAVEKPFHDFTRIELKNFQDESLGRITDLGIDLVNGRIVEVLVESDSSLNVDHKIVAVPPLAIFPDQINAVYRLNVTTEVFKAAPAIDLDQWLDAGRSDRVAAAYRHFGQEPYFLEEGAAASPADRRPKVVLGYVERSSKIQNMPVENLQHQTFGKVWTLRLDITKGRILSVVVLAPGNFQTKSIIPAMALSFNAARDGLLLDDTKQEFADEPRYVFVEAAYGQDSYSKQEPYQGPRTSVALEQGNSYRDVDRTVRINLDIRDAKISARHVEVGTLNGRVTLRGWVNTAEEQRRIGEIAVAAARLELVDNQITVRTPVAAE